jgi:hypothetical protein
MSNAFAELLNRNGLTISWRVAGVVLYRISVILLIAMLATFRASVDARVRETIAPIVALQISNSMPTMVQPAIAEAINQHAKEETAAAEQRFRDFHTIMAKEFVQREAHQDWVKETQEIKKLLVEVDKKLGILDQKVTDRLSP